MSKLRFTREPSGSFNFAESRLASINAALAERSGQQGALLPESLMQAASAELIRAVHKAADARGCTFDAAAKRVVTERPQLFSLTRHLTTTDADPQADVEIA
jgi:hypothetical protein